MLDANETLKAIQAMEELIPNPESDLAFEDPFQLLVAVILSAQTTDKAVNQIMPALMAKYPTAEALSQAQTKDIEALIRTIGLYRNKAKYLKAMATDLVEKFAGQVPDNRRDLESLAGVGRKTANVVLSLAFNQPAFAVDTHVERISKRLRMVPQDATPRQIERIMTEKLPEAWWSKAHLLMVLFGRYYSKANSSQCAELLGIEDMVEQTSLD
ncbi:endonuclease III [Ignavigranum ruoffiae]|uniref:endonuclease III n=1 Tax=Ignavigranum ruoffiae TaxID=89093 RepID=UPI0020642516|nr:endonuclease III [Ignavigranum ruoffiae]UPQ85587.1 endonuclease III [Ignavigranum ruoffiae]